MALQQAQMLLSMNSLEAVNVGVQQNNTESFAVVLCHLAELHAEQVGGVCVGLHALVPCSHLLYNWQFFFFLEAGGRGHSSPEAAPWF